MKVHDLGGKSNAGPIDKSEHEIEDWELLTDAISFVLNKKGIKTTDQHRRAIESLGERYTELSFYYRWAAATEMLLVEKGILTEEEINAKVAIMDQGWGSG